MGLKFPNGVIPEGVLDEVLNCWPISDLARELGVQNIKSSSSEKFIASCPDSNHKDETPSFSLYDNTNYCKCHGCDFGGGPVHIYAAVKGLDPRADFREIVEGIAEMNGTYPTLEAASQKRPENSARLTLEQKIFDANRKVAKALTKELKGNPRAKEYLTEKRGLSEETIDRFQLGFVGSNLVEICRALGIDDDVAVQASILKRDQDGTIKPFFFNRVMFPIEDEQGRMVGFGGRVLGDQKPKYLNTADTPVFKKGRLLYNYRSASKGQSRATGKALVTEGYMDVVGLDNAGIEYATGALGTSFSTDNAELLMKRFSDITFCFDGDEAGKKAAERALKNILPVMNGDNDIKFLMMPEGKDPDEYITERGIESFQNFVGGAWPLDEYFVEMLSNNHPSSMVGRSRMAKEAGGLIAKMPQSIYRDLLITGLSEELGVDREELKNHLEIMGAKPERQSQAPRVQQRGPVTVGPAEDMLENPVSQLKQEHFSSAKVSVPVQKPMTRERAFLINHNAAIRSWMSADFSMETQNITAFVHGVVARDVEINMGLTNPSELSSILGQFVQNKTGAALNESQVKYIQDIVVRANRISIDASEHTHSLQVDGPMQVVSGHKKSASVHGR